jgi:glycosyltransferase involved in cell wall biosynthesis
MRIAYISAGAAGMYCGSCLHDNTLAAALLELGDDVVLIPTYTPLRTDEADVSQRRVFFGGINVYLQQKSSLFRHTPWWLDRLLDHPAVLKLASSRATSVDPTQLGALTVSMLRGEEGRQHKELSKLADWLLDEVRPDVVHFSNSMLLGMARVLLRQCGPPILCSLSGEDLFLERLSPPYCEEAKRVLRERAREIHAFVSLNRYYADFMSGYLDVDRDRIHVIPHGLALTGHGTRRPQPAGVPRRIGYLARVCPDKGLHLLFEACERLASGPDIPAFELYVAGYLGIADRQYLRGLVDRAAAGPLAGRFHYVGEVTREEKIAFLQSLDVFSVPTVYRESKGLPALEAMANAVPVVLPAHGCFPELLADTGGGLLCRPHDVADLAEKLATLLRQPKLAEQLGSAGQHAVRDRYHARHMAQRTRDLYSQMIGK